MVSDIVQKIRMRNIVIHVLMASLSVRIGGEKTFVSALTIFVMARINVRKVKMRGTVQFVLPEEFNVKTKEGHNVFILIRYVMADVIAIAVGTEKLCHGMKLVVRSAKHLHFCVQKNVAAFY